jgi:UDP-glucose 4-epimerase
MAVFITGAGLIGCHTARRLVDDGQRVVLFDAAPRQAYVDRIVGPGRGEVVRGDLRDLPDLVAQVQRAQAESIVHTAGLIGLLPEEKPYTGIQINLMGSVNVAEAARLAGVRRVVFASTHGVYATRREATAPMDESFPIQGDLLYGATKVAAEQLYQHYERLYGTSYVILRYPQVYGLGHFGGGSSGGEAVQELLDGALSGRPTSVSPRLFGRNEYIYAKDVARANALALRADAPSRVYNIGTGVLTSAEEMIATVRALLPDARLTLEQPDPPPVGYRTFPYVTRRAATELGFEAEYPLQAGLRDFLAELRAS